MQIAAKPGQHQSQKPKAAVWSFYKRKILVLIKKIFRQLFILPIRLYQIFLSPIMGNNCRYTPTCSHYMVDAINEWGVLRGFWMGIKRIGRCHPWSKHDTIDPVPPNPGKKANKVP